MPPHVLDTKPTPAKAIRRIVAERACPTCGALAGEPCENVIATTLSDRYVKEHRKRSVRRYYQNYIHAARRKP
jgi:hypothetical protein